MKKILKQNITTIKKVTDFTNYNEVKERLLFSANNTQDQVFDILGTCEEGMTEIQIEKSQEKYGNNIVTHGKKDSLFKRICDAFINPFTLILFVLAIVSTFTDIIFAEPGEQSFATVIIITSMVFI